MKCCALLLSLLLCLGLTGCVPAEVEIPAMPVQAAEAAEAEEPAAEDGTQDFVSYTATEDQLTDEVLARVVASCGGKELDNRMLDFYYWQQYYTFANNYGAYLSYLMDTSKGLDEQAYSDTETWQQAFLTGAADMFHSITALNLEADAAGFELSEEDQAQLDAIAQSLDATADYYGMESGLAYLQASFGPKATVEDYVAFARDNLRASRYLEKLMDEMEFTDAEISDYYDQNADTYAESRVEKIDKPMVNVRHILVMPAEQNEDGTYTDEAWAEAEQKAQELLDTWKAGEATEESFAALANENSEDPGSSTNGGLYEDVYPGQMVDSFDAWCFDEARQPGDTGIVKTDYGYHVMYFVSKGEEIFWFEGHKYEVTSVAFSPDGKLVVSVDGYYHVYIWDAESGAVFQKSELSWNAVSFSPDAKLLVSCYDKDVIIWEFEPLQELIDRTRERFENRPLTQDEKKKYYLD